MRTLRMKMVMIMVILILALMTVIGAFLISGVGNFYISEFYVQMERTFSPEFITQLQDLADGENGPTQMKELLMAQTGLGIDVNDRNVYILDSLGQVLEGSDERTQVSVSQNLLTAMNGEVGQDGSVTGEFMDLAVPIVTDEHSYIAYIYDNRATVDALTSELMSIILRALGLGLVICVVLSFLLARILITPIQALTVGTRQVAAGDFFATCGRRGPRRDRRARAELQPHGKGPRGHDLRGRERAQQALHAVFAHDRRRHRLLGLRCADPLQPGGEPDARARADSTTTFDELFGQGGRAGHAADAAPPAIFRVTEDRGRPRAGAVHGPVLVRPDAGAASLSSSTMSPSSANPSSRSVSLSRTSRTSCAHR